MKYPEFFKNAANRFLKKHKTLLFSMNLLILLIVFGKLLQPHFSPDFFAVHVNGASEFPHHVRNGRIVYGVVLCFVQLLGLRVTDFASLYTVLFICTAAYCIMRISTMMCQYTGTDSLKKKLSCSFALLLSVINICMTEWFLFSECMLMYTLALLFATEGALVFSHHNLSLAKKAFLSFAALFISINCYQAMLGWYITLSLITILASESFKLSKNTVFYGASALAVGGMNALINQLIVRFFAVLGLIESPARQAAFSIKGLFTGLLNSIPAQVQFLYDSYTLMPRFFLIAAFIIGIAFLIASVYKNQKSRAWYIQVGLILFVLLVGYLIVYLPHFSSNSTYITPRSIAGLFLILGLLFALASLWSTNRMHIFVVLCIAAILAVSNVHIARIIDDHLLTSQRDLDEAQAILRAIEAHEQSSGIQIKEVCVLRDSDPTYSYPDITTSVMDFNHRQMAIDWEQVNILVSLSNRPFDHVYVSSEERSAIVQDRNWNALNLDEQLIFEGNRLYIIMF